MNPEDITNNPNFQHIGSVYKDVSTGNIVAVINDSIVIPFPAAKNVVVRGNNGSNGQSVLMG